MVIYTFNTKINNNDYTLIIYTPRAIHNNLYFFLNKLLKFADKLDTYETVFVHLCTRVVYAKILAIFFQVSVDSEAIQRPINGLN